MTAVSQLPNETSIRRLSDVKLFAVESNTRD
jgi:hypothetical protein